MLVADTRLEIPTFETAEQAYDLVKALITELHAWGVTPDYMMGQGVAKDIVIRVHLEENLPIPPHHKQNYLQRQAEKQSLVQEGARPAPQSVPMSAKSSTDSLPASTAMEGHKRSMSGLRLGPMFAAPLPSQVTRHRSSSSESSISAASLPAHLPHRPDWVMAQPAPVSQPVLPRPDLSEKEARAREQLLARKAAMLAARSAAGPGSIAGIAASAPPATLPADVPNSEIVKDVQQDVSMDFPRDEERNKSVERQPQPVQQVAQSDGTSMSATREKLLDLGEEATDQPVHQHFVGIAGMPADLPSPTSSAADSLSFRKSLQPPAAKQRPVAADFLNEPSQAASLPRWSARLMPTPTGKGMVIDLSDEEDDDADMEELRHSVEEAKSQRDGLSTGSYRVNTLRLQPPRSFRPPSEDATTSKGENFRFSPSPQPSAGHTRRPSPPSAYAQIHVETPVTAVAALSPDDQAKAKLEAKQAEIKRMMEMISRLESKKKGKCTGSLSGTPTASNTASPVVQRAGLPTPAPTPDRIAHTTLDPHGLLPEETADAGGNNEVVEGQVSQLKDAKALLQMEVAEMTAAEARPSPFATLHAGSRASAELGRDGSTHGTSSDSSGDTMLVIREDSAGSEDMQVSPGVDTSEGESEEETGKLSETGQFTPPMQEEMASDTEVAERNGTSALRDSFQTYIASC